MKSNETWDDRYGILNRPDLHFGVQTVTGPFAPGVDSGNCTILVNVAVTTITLPLASANKGRAFYIKKIAAGAGVITLSPALGDQIEGAGANVAFVGITAQFDSLLIVSDGGTGWWILASANSTSP